MPLRGMIGRAARSRGCSLPPRSGSQPVVRSSARPGGDEGSFHGPAEGDEDPRPGRAAAQPPAKPEANEEDIDPADLAAGKPGVAALSSTLHGSGKPAGYAMPGRLTQGPRP